MDERDEAFEQLRGGHGLLRELPGVRVWGVDDGALVLGEDATHFVFCHQGALTVRQSGTWPHVLTAGMYGPADAAGDHGCGEGGADVRSGEGAGAWPPRAASMRKAPRRRPPYKRLSCLPRYSGKFSSFPEQRIPA